MGWLILALAALLILGGGMMPRVLQIFGRDAFASPDTGEIVLHPELLAKLELLYDRVQGRLRIPGASGYRTPAYNADVGGHQNSRHLFGMAVDVTPAAGLKWDELYRAALAVGFQGVIWEKTPPVPARKAWGPHLHLDVGPRVYHAIV